MCFLRQTKHLISATRYKVGVAECGDAQQPEGKTWLLHQLSFSWSFLNATGTHPSERHYGRGDATLESVPRSLSIPGNIQAYYLEYEGRPTKRFLGQRPELLKPRLLSHGAREGYAPRRELGGICYEGGVFFRRPWAPGKCQLVHAREKGILLSIAAGGEANEGGVVITWSVFCWSCLCVCLKFGFETR